MERSRFVDCWPVCCHAGSPTPVLLACNASITTASAVGFVLEIPCRATLAKAARRASLAARFLGYPVKTRGKLRRQVAVCCRKPRAGQLGGKNRRLAISGRDECVDLVTRNRTPWRALLRQRRGFPRAGADLVDRNGAGLRPASVERHRGRPSRITCASKHGISSAFSFCLQTSLRAPRISLSRAARQTKANVAAPGVRIVVAAAICK